MESLIGVKNLRYHVDSFSLHIDQFHIKEKEIHVLLGPTGSGKTLLLEFIVGLLPQTTGEFFIAGQKANHLPPEKRDIAYVPQDLALFPHLTVSENLRYALKFKPKAKIKSYEAQLEKLIAATKIKQLLKRYPVNLSGGEKQRVALVRALAAQPRLLLLDEPFSAVHPSLKIDLWQLLKKLQQELSLTVLMVTHDVEEALALGQVISFISHGRIRQTAKRREIYYHPKSLEVASYFGLKNLFPAKVTAINSNYLQLETEGLGKVKVASHFHNQEIYLEDKVYWGIHPEEITVVKPERKNQERENLFLTQITEEIEVGRFHLLKAQILKQNVNVCFELHLPSYIRRRFSFNSNKVEIELKPEHIFLIKEDR